MVLMAAPFIQRGLPDDLAHEQHMRELAEDVWEDETRFLDQRRHYQSERPRPAELLELEDA